MGLVLTRFNLTDKGTEGVLTLDGKFLCWTLEDPVRKITSQKDKVDGNTAIPKGEYKTIVNMSTRFHREMIQLLDVPYFKGIRIHGGNTTADTEGCILVAQNRVSPMVIQGSMEKGLTELCKCGKITSIKIVEAI